MSFNKTIAQKVQALGVTTLDGSVYSRGRLWRMQNSINTKSGLHKIPLQFEELRDLSITGIQKLAQQPRPEDSYAIPMYCPATADWYQRTLSSLNLNRSQPSHQANQNKPPAKGTTVEDAFKNGWRMVPCVKALEQATLSDGSRHQSYFQLSRYYAYLHMHPEEIKERLVTIDQRHPIQDDHYIDRVSASAVKYQGFPGCDNSVLSRFCCKPHCFLFQDHKETPEKGPGIKEKEAEHPQNQNKPKACQKSS